MSLVKQDDDIVTEGFWDARYGNSSGDEPTHEWMGATSVQKLFQRNLFDVPGLRPEDNPLILHLGSGDSVSMPVLLGYITHLTASRSSPSIWPIRATGDSYAPTSPPWSWGA